jgi:transcriptional regulator with XRE-family HTH domain
MAQDQAHTCDLATLIKTARRRAHLTQQQVASQAHVHPSYISKIERQHRSAPGLGLLRVGQVLDIEAGILMHAILQGPCPTCESPVA